LLESDRRRHLIIGLIGLPGSGKSTVGRLLARRLQIPFLDSDQVTEQRLGCTVREFFEREGEERFRTIEAEIIEDLTLREFCVLSTGGGVVLRQENRNCLHSRCQVVYLKSTPEELYRRLKHDINRPLLQVEDPLKKLQELFTQREPLYKETAHFVIETGRPSVPTLVNMILMQLELAGVKLS
jgi:shikimate kinase